MAGFVQTVNTPSRRGIAQALQGGAHQGCATVAIIKKLHRRWDDQPIHRDALAQGGDLAGNGVRFGLLLRGDPGIEGHLQVGQRGQLRRVHWALLPLAARGEPGASPDDTRRCLSGLRRGDATQR